MRGAQRGASRPAAVSEPSAPPARPPIPSAPPVEPPRPAVSQVAPVSAPAFDSLGASTPAGTTDLLVTYTYRIAFENSGQDYGLASAMVSTMRLLGQMLSMGLALMVFAIFIGNVQITPDRYPALLASIRTIFSVCTVLCFLGVFVSLVKGKKRRQP